MHSLNSQTALQSHIFQAVRQMNGDGWCFVPVNSDCISMCDQGFLDIWGLKTDLNSVLESGLSLLEGEIGDRLDQLKLDRFWLMRLCRTSDHRALDLPQDLPIYQVERLVVFDEHRFPVGTLLNCHARHKVTLSDEVWHRVTEFRRLLNELTPREISILALVFEGMTNKEVSEAVSISAKTIEKHRAKIMRKLHVQGVVELVRRMAETSLAFPDEPIIKGRSGFD